MGGPISGGRPPQARKAYIAQSSSAVSFFSAAHPRTPAPETLTAAQGAQPAGKGPFKIDFEIKDMMSNVIDFTADKIWLHQGWDIDRSGEHPLFPTTDQGWIEVERESAVLAEAANALMLPGRAIDQESWIKYATQLHDRSMESYRTAKARDKDAFFRAGSYIYEASTACHQKYILGEKPVDQPDLR
jgi:hypothetical protein